MVRTFSTYQELPQQRTFWFGLDSPCRSISGGSGAAARTGACHARRGRGAAWTTWARWSLSVGLIVALLVGAVLTCWFGASGALRSRKLRFNKEAPAEHILRDNEEDIEWQSLGDGTMCSLTNTTAKGKANVKNVQALSMLDCIGHCRQRGEGCTAIEYAEGHCDLWSEPIGYFQLRPGYQCVVKVPPGSFSTKKDSACRIDENDYTTDAEGTVQSIINVGEGACKTLCLSLFGTKCTGVEYYANASRCEMWRLPIDYQKPSKGFSCSTYNALWQQDGKTQRKTTAISSTSTTRLGARTLEPASESDAVDGSSTKASSAASSEQSMNDNCVYRPAFQDAWCNEEVLFDNSGEAQGYDDLPTCQAKCTEDIDCHFVLWGWNPSGYYRCATFRECKERSDYAEDGPAVFRKDCKLSGLRPQTSRTNSTIAHAVAMLSPHQKMPTLSEHSEGQSMAFEDRANTSISTPGDRSSKGEGEIECNTPLCSASRWDGWGVVFPWLVTSTSTSTTTTSTPTTTTTTTTTTSSTVTTSTTSTSGTTTTTTTSSITTSSTTTACHTAEDGEKCYKETMWAMQKGIRQHSTWYPGLTEWSSFEEFQTVIHEKSATAECGRPCECHTAISGEHCHANTMWAMKTGIHQHPEWYPHLTTKSSFEDFQIQLWRENRKESNCSRSCKAPSWGSPSLFCFSITRMRGYEPEMIKVQIERAAGIFACDDYAVLSDEVFKLGNGPRGPVSTIKFRTAKVGISKDGTAGNALLFIRAWDQINQATMYSSFDWTVKADPDAVLVPSRLRSHLAKFTGRKVYIRNCNKVPESSDFPMMFGSLEALSKHAIEAYFKGVDRCRKQLDWYSWGEDYFLGHCLDLLGVVAADDFSIVSDGVCSGVNCRDSWAAAFHPFKSKEKWLKCWKEATG